MQSNNGIECESIERAIPGKDEWVHLHADHLSRYLYAEKFVRGMRVLDAGTGPGYGAAMLAAMGATSVQAVDIAPDVIADAEKRFAGLGIQFMVDDCQAFNKVQTPVDVVCSFENIEHLEHPEEFVKAAARVLNENGVLLCSSPDKALTEHTYINGRSPNHFHVNEWRRDEFARLLEEGFSSVEVFSQVESVSLSSRRVATQAVQEHLKYLWSNPLVRLGRGCARLLGRRPQWPNVAGLATPSPSDFPIVSSSLTGVVGGPWCHVAVCRGPKK